MEERAGFERAGHSSHEHGTADGDSCTGRDLDSTRMHDTRAGTNTSLLAGSHDRGGSRAVIRDGIGDLSLQGTGPFGGTILFIRKADRHFAHDLYADG